MRGVCRAGMPTDVETAISLVLDVLEKQGTLFVQPKGKERSKRTPEVRFSVGPFTQAVGPSGYKIIGTASEPEPDREFYGPTAAADCARAIVNLCGSALAEQAVNEWKENGWKRR